MDFSDIIVISLFILILVMIVHAFTLLQGYNETADSFCKDRFKDNGNYYCSTNGIAQQFVCHFDAKECFWVSDSGDSDNQ